MLVLVGGSLSIGLLGIGGSLIPLPTPVPSPSLLTAVPPSPTSALPNIALRPFAVYNDAQGRYTVSHPASWVRQEETATLARFTPAGDLRYHGLMLVNVYDEFERELSWDERKQALEAFLTENYGKIDGFQFEADSGGIRPHETVSFSFDYVNTNGSFVPKVKIRGVSWLILSKGTASIIVVYVPFHQYDNLSGDISELYESYRPR